MKLFGFIGLLMAVYCLSVKAGNLHLGDSQEMEVDNKSEQYLPIGTWEGVYPNYGEVKVLQVTEQNSHRLATFKITAGLQLIEEVEFTDKDIECNPFDCRVVVKTREGLLNQITFTQYLDTDFEVTEAIKLKNGTISSTNYQILKTKYAPLPVRFRQNEGDKFNAKVDDQSSPWVGYWLGVLKTVDVMSRNKVVSLDFTENGIATFNVYTPGINGQAKLVFKRSDIVQDDGEFFIPISGSRFASEMILRPVIRDVIRGEYKARHHRNKHFLLGEGDFTLYKVTDKQPYKKLLNTLEKMFGEK